MLELGERASAEAETEEDLDSHHQVGRLVWSGETLAQPRVISSVHGLVERIISFCHITSHTS